MSQFHTCLRFQLGSRTRTYPPCTSKGPFACLLLHAEDPSLQFAMESSCAVVAHDSKQRGYWNRLPFLLCHSRSFTHGASIHFRSPVLPRRTRNRNVRSGACSRGEIGRRGHGRSWDISACSFDFFGGGAELICPTVPVAHASSRQSMRTASCLDFSSTSRIDPATLGRLRPRSLDGSLPRPPWSWAAQSDNLPDECCFDGIRFARSTSDSM